jgi:hypothetical protein
MPNLTGDSSGINLANPINLGIPADGQPASVESALGIRAVFQNIVNYIKALVVRGDGHNTRLLTVENLNLGTRVPSLESQMVGVRTKTDHFAIIGVASATPIVMASGLIQNGKIIPSQEFGFVALPGCQIGDVIVISNAVNFGQITASPAISTAGAVDYTLFNHDSAPRALNTGDIKFTVLRFT